MRLSLPRPLLALLFATLPGLARAQAGGATLTGTVANAKTRAFLEQAEVRVAGRAALTDREGRFSLAGPPAGAQEVGVSYTGLDDLRETVTLAPGTTARREFALTSAIYRMDAFVVASEIEGNAAAINAQKKADFLVQAISADTLGNEGAQSKGSRSWSRLARKASR
ncbi:MAG: carboxypeptidase-like regulatory domain-containing protein [Verrucomicrobia bacterium]|nr:carboxypeptidase-like regulatory domain-containing protein [Verrucomicrobiota bacterium]